MLFNSCEFIFVFLPIALLGYHLAGKVGGRVPIAWLTACSLFFYGYWNPAFLSLLISSIWFNYLLGRFIGRSPEGSCKRIAFIFGAACNVALLFAFKYAGPILNFSTESGWISGFAHLDIILPLGISFFTFTQVGYLVDRRDGLAQELGLLRYTLFVTFFPHLIAGPILHVREIGVQLSNPNTFRLRNRLFMPGLSLFALGLAKKVLIADPLSPIVASGFSSSADLSVLGAWMTALGYMVQLYFDFSGYSDMAIGLAGMFGFSFPNNFNSPYKARSIIDFWQRWHMTLSRYIALLLFNPVALAVTRWRVSRGLKVSRKALAQPFTFVSMIVFPTFFAMGLAGIWHGAGLQFLVFGLLHATYLSLNHAWRVWGASQQGQAKRSPSIVTVIAQVALTQLAVLVAFIFFRADSCATAIQILGNMVTGDGPENVAAELRTHAGDVAHIAAAFSIIWLAPNSMQIFADDAPILESLKPAGPHWLRWRAGASWGLATALLLGISVLSFGNSTEFLYFQF